MIFHGFQKTTLLDYPGHIAAIVFVNGCNFRCPYCHNSSLVLASDNGQTYSENDILSFLRKRKGLTEGLCISGGEPTLYKELPAFIQKVKQEGFFVKLDTNGTNPEMLHLLLKEKLIDYVAMDIKASPERYQQITGFTGIPYESIQASIALLLSSDIDYEFRTTIVREFHDADMIRDITNQIKGCRRYYLQNYNDSGDILIHAIIQRDNDSQTEPVLSAFSKEQAAHLLHIARENIPNAELR